MTDKEVKVRVTADTGDFQSKMNGVSSTMNKTASSFQSFGSKIKGMFNTFSQGISTLSNFQTMMNTNLTKFEKNRIEAEKLKQALNDTKAKYMTLGDKVKIAGERLERMTEQFGKNSSQAKLAKNEQERLTEEFDKTANKMRQYEEELKKVEEGTKELTSIKDMANELKGAWEDFKNGDFGSAFEKIASAGKGLFMLMPGWVKVTTGLVTAIDQLYQAGKQQFFSGLERVKDMLTPIVDITKKIGSSIKSAFEQITGVSLDLSSSIANAVEFESAMARVNAVAKGNDDTLKILTDTARDWGAKTRYSATEVADAMYYMGMAGWNTQEIMDGLEGVLNLATVGCVDLGTASDFVTDGLTALGMSASQANDFVDMLSATIINSNTGVEQMQEAFTNVAPIAGTLGISMSDLTVAIGAMADNGVKGAKAGTALKNLLSRMASPTDKMTACIQKYNLEGARQKIINGDLIGGLKEMQTQIDGLTASEKTAIFTTIAGREALSGISALMNTNTTRLNELKFAVDSSTKSGRAYAESLGLIDKEGNVLIKDFNNMTEAQQKAYSQWENFNSIMNECADTMTYVGGSTTDLGAIIAKLGEDGEVTVDQVNEILNVFDKLKSGSEEVTGALKDYGIEIAYAEDGSFDFSGTLKNLGAVWDELSDSEKQALANQLGLGDSVEELNELYSNNGESIEELVDAYEQMNGVSEHLAETFDATLKGSILKLSSAIQERLLQVFDKIKPAVQGVVDVLGEFFNIWNGMSEVNSNLKGMGDAFKYLEEQSEGWGKAISDGIVNAIQGIDDFINGGSFDSILNIGTNIIQGICDGISKAKENGSLDSAIDGAIKKICKWIETNAPAVEKAGKTIMNSLSDGIKNNKKEISTALDSVMSVIDTWARGSDKLDSAMSTFADKMIDSLVQAVGRAVDKKKGEVWEEIKSLFTPDDQPDMGKGFFDDILKFIFPEDTIEPPKTFGDKVLGFAKDIGSKFIGWFTGESYACEVEDSGLKTTENYNKGLESGTEGTKSASELIGNTFGQGIIEAINQSKGQVTSAFTEMQNSARTSMVGMSNIARNQFVNLANIVRNQMVNSCNIVRNQCVNMANIFRNQFVSMANVTRNQMLNVSNIIRNQAVTWSNIIRNQVQNARNALTSSFISMASVARTQMVNISNIVRNQAVNWSNIIRNQASNARNALTSSFMSMVAVVRTQMSKCLSIVRSTMASIASATSRKLTINVGVNKTVTTSYKTVGDAPANLSMPMSAMSMAMPMSPVAMSRAGSSVGLGTVLGAMKATSNDRPISIEVPLNVDGRQMAKVTAKYMDGELKVIENRNDRRRGVK